MKSANVRQVLLKVDDAVYALNQVKEEHTPQKESLFLEAFNAYDEAGRTVRDEIAKAKRRARKRAKTLLII